MKIEDNFAEAFLSASCSSPDFDLQDFVGQICPAPKEMPPLPFRLLSGGTILAPDPFSFEIRSLDCFMLLYTISGAGSLRIGKQILFLTPPSLLFLDCRRRFCLSASVSPWEYQIFFVSGQAFSCFCDLMPEQGFLLMPLAPGCETAQRLEKLLLFPSNPSLHSALIVSSLLDSVITDCIASRYPQEETLTAPGYLEEIRKLFETRYAENYTLDGLAARFHVNKYRFSHEFHSFYGCSPIQYLNRQRIQAAKNLLLTSNCKVHEAGRLVGIENTNHFISLCNYSEPPLFKDEIRMT
ncbi:MAG: helix-turn-helix transcriptional regulator [Lachnospiraceae bacterium]|nr:helix-turn-helix transcriptional regulator [Lachnospiraceae bacterium]